MDRLLWILLVIFLSLLASLAGTFVAWLFHKAGYRKVGGIDFDAIDTKRNAPKGAAAVVFWIFAALGCGGLMMCVGVSLVMILIKNLPDTGPEDPNRDKAPVEQKPVGPVAEDLGPQEKQTRIVGGHADAAFKDEAPPGGHLIGFNVGVGEMFRVNLVKGIEPIYRTPQGEATGRKFGTDFSKVVTVKAKTGYAVGAVNVKAGAMVNGFSVKFMRVKGAALNPADSYTSPWIGDKTGGGGPTTLGGDGTMIVGVIGKRNAEDCTGLGLLKK